MLDHLGINVSDFERSRDFYAKALAPLGLKQLMEPAPGFCGFGGDDGKPNYYGAFVLDPDGNNVEACCHGPG
jgi:catechol 2,3-dioxygenase-like lactoylglutathione lyase family enzyme